MARGINKVILIGNLGADPEIRYTSSGTAVCTLSVATNDSYKDRDGNLVEKTEWHRCVAWSRLAEICGEYLKKGSQVYFEGQLQTRQYEDKDGNTRYTTEIKVREMTMLGGRGGDGGSAFDSTSSAGGGRKNGYATESGAAKPAQSDDDYSFEPDADLPF